MREFFATTTDRLNNLFQDVDTENWLSILKNYTAGHNYFNLFSVAEKEGITSLIAAVEAKKKAMTMVSKNMTTFISENSPLPITVTFCDVLVITVSDSNNFNKVQFYLELTKLNEYYENPFKIIGNKKILFFESESYLRGIEKNHEWVIKELKQKNMFDEVKNLQGLKELKEEVDGLNIQNLMCNKHYKSLFKMNDTYQFLHELIEFNPEKIHEDNLLTMKTIEHVFKKMKDVELFKYDLSDCYRYKKTYQLYYNGSNNLQFKLTHLDDIEVTRPSPYHMGFVGYLVEESSKAKLKGESNSNTSIFGAKLIEDSAAYHVVYFDDVVFRLDKRKCVLTVEGEKAWISTNNFLKYLGERFEWDNYK